MTKKYYWLLCLFCISGATFGQQSPFHADIAVLVKLINAKDSQSLLERMSDSCRIGNLPPMENSYAVPEILSKIQGIREYTVLSDSLLANGEWRSDLEATYNDGTRGTPFFIFNREGKLTNLGLIKMRQKADPVAALQKALAIAEKPDILHIPFRLVDGLILVPAVLNGQQGYFMLDSGSPVAIISKAFVQAEHIKKDFAVNLTGMGGQMQGLVWSSNNSIALGDLQVEHLELPATPALDAPLEDDSPVFGLLGYEFLRDYEWTFDYGKEELTLIRVDQDGRPIDASTESEKPLSVSPFRMKRHIPIVDLQVGGQTYPMGIDCGANSNVMHTECLPSLAPFMAVQEDNIQINGVGGTGQAAKVAYVQGAKIGDLALQDMYTVFTDQQIGGGAEGDTLPVVGLLGTPFLYQFKTAINFQKGEIRFYR